MKKLLAILLSVLMLCTAIPFATVSAEEGINIVVEVSETEVNAGDEFEVTVYLEGNPGVIGATVEIEFDSNALALYGEWDGADFYPEISHPRKWKLNFIQYAPDDTRCIVQYVNGTATSDITEEEFFTAVFVAKEDAYTGDYDLTVKYNPMDFFGATGIGGQFKDIAILGVENGSIHINGSDPLPPACEHEYEYECDKVCALCGEETRPEADHAYVYACDQYCNLCGDKTNPGADHSITHVEAKEAVSCIEFGNREYWTCDDCGAAWLDESLMIQTNLRSVMTAGECVSDAEAPCQDGVCINCGLPCYATEEHAYFSDCDTVCMNCNQETREAGHNVVHAEAKDSTCTENGNIEYWYCDVCGAAWLDEACTMNTNLKAVKLPLADHVYDDDADLDCNNCGYIREVLAPIAVLDNLGTSVCPDVNGLAFGFSVKVADLTVENTNEFLTGAVIPFDNGESYTLSAIGAVMTNEADAVLERGYANGGTIVDVPALLLSDTDISDGAIEFAVRIVNIPNYGKNATISARPYFVYSTVEGEEIVVYGDVIASSYNEASVG